MDKYDDKLDEARFFVERVKEAAQSSDPWPLTCYLRAFVAAARSVAAYLQKEAKDVGRRKEYYDLHDPDPVLTFFRNVRNDNLKVNPLHPTKYVVLTVNSASRLNWFSAAMATRSTG